METTRVLVTWGSVRGGTEGIGRTLAGALREHGIEVVEAPARGAPAPPGFDAVVVGGALYANRWARDARRYVRRHETALRRVPVWFFSSGPLDDSAERGEIPPPRQVVVLAERVGALGHATFGGRLAPDARGFPAAAMARDHSGDWRDPERIRAWAKEIARDLPRAAPGTAVDHPAASPGRLVGYALAGWALSATIRASLAAVASPGVAAGLHATLAPLVFGLLAWRYFGAKGSRDGLPTASTWALAVVALDGLLGLALPGGGLAPASVVGIGLPAALGFAVVWSVGALRSMAPAGTPAPAARGS